MFCAYRKLCEIASTGNLQIVKNTMFSQNMVKNTFKISATNLIGKVEILSCRKSLSKEAFYLFMTYQQIKILLCIFFLGFTQLELQNCFGLVNYSM